MGQVFQRLLDGWTDPAAYASGFALDAVHIGTGGRLDRGRGEIMDGHAGVLSSLGRGSSKAGRIDRLQSLTADVALLTVYGDIAFDCGVDAAVDHPLATHRHTQVDPPGGHPGHGQCGRES